MSHFPNIKDKINNKQSKHSGAALLESTIHCKPIPLNPRLEKQNSSKSNRSILTTQSDGSIIKNQETGFKQKLVNKVKSWSSKDKSHREIASSSKEDHDLTAITCGLENLCIKNSEDCLSEIFKAKDSLENILVAKTEFSVNGDMSASSAQEIEIAADILPAASLQQINVKDTSTKMTWDPWNKIGRKNKRDKKRKEKSPHTSRERNTNNLLIKKSKDHTAGDEPQANEIDHIQQDSYEYQPYRTNRKSVDFVNEVAVVYFTGDEIISRVVEPLKKELDQQIRNKEMRHGHVPCTLLNKNQEGGEDYMSAWFKK